MRVALSTQSPSAQELIGHLYQHYSKDYTYKRFGLGKKSIIVKKSTMVGAQISMSNHEITIDGMPPSPMASILYALGHTELAIVLFPSVSSARTSATLTAESL